MKDTYYSAEYNVAYYQDVEFTDKLPEFTNVIRYEDIAYADDYDDVVSEAYAVWEKKPQLVACSIRDEIFWFITEDGHMYNRDVNGFYLEGFFLGTKEIHIDPYGHYEMW